MQDGFSTAGVIRPDGSLGGERVLRRETLYRGLNGNRVERFWDARRSYIYKPVGFPKTAGREQWVARHLRPLLAGIRMPDIVAASVPRPGEAAGPAWLIYEDLGELRPPRDAADAARAAGWAAAWHRLSADLVPASFDGHTPRLEEVAEQIGADPAALRRRLARAGVAEAAKWADRLPELVRLVPPRETVCHGDYYPGNIAVNFPEPVVLDWEFVQRNHPYWDLYCLLDITSFRYRKIPLENRDRIAALRRYRAALGDEHGAERENPAEAPAGGDAAFAAFAVGYAAFAAVYSAWILGLIERDLASGRAERRALERQWRETAGVLIDCLSLIGEQEAKGAYALP